MNNNCGKEFWDGRAAHSITLGLLAAFAVLAASGIASAQDKVDSKDQITFNLLPNPTTPPAITPPAGNVLFLAGHRVGTQGYVCLPKGTGAS
jgi:hypothetical protein